jgi:hypothetical protein
LPSRYPAGVVAQDRSGNIWFGHDGALRFDGSECRSYGPDDGWSAYAWDIITDTSGRIWAATPGGVRCFDGHSWTTYTTEDGLGSNDVRAVCEAADGSIWVGARQPYQQPGSGIARFLEGHWDTYEFDGDYADNSVYSIYQDRSEMVWFGTGGGLLRRYDGSGWEVIDTDTGRTGFPIIEDIVQARDGSIWLATVGYGTMHFDGTRWESFDPENSVVNTTCTSVIEDRDGDIWVAGDGGAYHYDGEAWASYPGEFENNMLDVFEDERGALWFAGLDLTRFDGSEWRTIFPKGVSGLYTYAIVQGPSNALWVGTGEGLVLYEPDYVAPKTVLVAAPPVVSGSRFQSATYLAAFGETRGIEFSYSLDESGWSAWVPTNAWSETGLADGVHVFEVRARDWMGNVDPTPAVCTFEIDGTPPMPQIASPAFGEAVRGAVVVRGTAWDGRFRSYRVDLRPATGGAWNMLHESFIPVSGGALGGWDTRGLPDGDYELRLTVADTLGLTGAVAVRVIVDNEAPWAYETAPAEVKAAAGGNIYTTGREVHLYFPPHAFGEDTEVDIEELVDSQVPDTLEGGVRRVFAGYGVSWGGAELEKAATLEMTYAEDSSGLASEPSIEAGTLTFYLFGADSTWHRLGGTVDASTGRISSPISEPGRYAIYGEAGKVSGRSSLSDLVVTPRVFSPRGGFASEEVAIGFTLGRPGPVTVKVYNRAGRLVREVASGREMNAGANLVRWDGRDSDANQAEDGLYLVVVEASGKKETKTLAIVR